MRLLGKLALFVVLATLGLPLFLKIGSHAPKVRPRGQIIYLNGTSSSGKSTLSHALQEALDEPFLHIGIDQVIGLTPEKINDWTGGEAPQGFSWSEEVQDGRVVQKLQIGPFAQKIGKTYKALVKTLLEQNHSVIIDDVAFGKEYFDQWKSLLGNENVLYVRVSAPLEVIEKRESDRGNRMVGTARGQYHLVHHGVSYDLEVDTHAQSLEENVQKIIEHLNRKG